MSSFTSFEESVARFEINMSKTPWPQPLFFPLPNGRYLRRALQLGLEGLILPMAETATQVGWDGEGWPWMAMGPA